MALLTDIRRFRKTGALPCGPSQVEQDAVFLDALDVVDGALAEIAKAKAAEKDGGGGAR